MLLKTATLLTPFSDFVPNKFADLKPVQLLMRFNRKILSIWSMSVRE
jgi:hypothetical protein